MVRRVSKSGVSGKPTASKGYREPVSRKKKNDKRIIHKVGGRTIEFGGKRGMSAVLTLANGRIIKFVCRKGNWHDSPVLRVYTNGRSTRAPTAREMNFLKSFKTLLIKKNWTFPTKPKK